MLAATLALALADTPEAAVKEFVAAWNKGDLAAAARLVEGADPDADQRELSGFLAKKSIPPFALLQFIRIGSRFQVQIVADMGEREMQKIRNGDPVLENVAVAQSADGWRLVPVRIEEVGPLLSGKDENGGERPVPMLQLLATVVRYPEMQHGFILGITSKAALMKNRTKALMNVKALALASLMFAGDHDDKLALTPETAERFLTPYLKDKDAFLDPATARRDSYRLNPSLAGVNLAMVESPATTVLWYLGDSKGILYPYEGKTVVAFVDGSTRVVTEADTLKFRWKP